MLQVLAARVSPQLTKAVQKLLSFAALSLAASTCLPGYAATYHVAPAALAGIDAKTQFRTILFSVIT